MRGARRFSQAISEGDGISLLAEVHDGDSAARAEQEGAEGIVVRGPRPGVREATELPILWCVSGSLGDARAAGADAALVVVSGLEDEDGRLEDLYSDALELGLDCVVEVRDEDELQLALDRLDPEIFLLTAERIDEKSALEHALGLLLDVPAGKLAIAGVRVTHRDEVAELERAGVDAVIVGAGDVSELVGESSEQQR
jgi:indole-3-glycerol phosphate synthase